MALAGTLTALAVNRLSKYLDDLHFLVYSLVTLIVCVLFMAVVPVLADEKTVVTVLFYCVGILKAAFIMAFTISTRAMLAKFVPENIQTVSEAFRSSLEELAYFLAGVIASLPDHYMFETMVTMAFIMVLLLSWLIVNANKFKDVQVIQVHEN